MGNLHAGHLSLVEEAKRHGRCVVASIFVNRLQFEPGGDFDRYPRTLEEDCGKLEAAGCHVAFAPDEKELYPAAQEIVLSPPKSAEQLCGEFRPGHFQGVVTVVAKLFNIVAPHSAVFGRKDYQQLFVIRELVRQMNYPIAIVGVETKREPDGLAMSSRNGYLSREERAEAVRLSRNLKRIRERVAAGRRDFDALCEGAREDLAAAGWRVDYVAIRNRSRLSAPGPEDRDLVVLGAAWLGRTRLIDNVEMDAP
jgi:pantoate--beta-alanine ligase